MIKRLSNIFSAVKTFLYSNTAARVILYAAIAAALLWTWLMSDGGSVAFVYNEF